MQTFNADTLVATCANDTARDVRELSVVELMRELDYLRHKCATVASFGGAMARAGIWQPRIRAIEAELQAR